MSKSKHIDENLGALGWMMEAEDIERLRREFPSVELPQTLIRFNKLV